MLKVAFEQKSLVKYKYKYDSFEVKFRDYVMQHTNH